MPVTPTYPGIYIEELPSSTHTIAPSPTSITVFVGYTHPFKTRSINWGQAIQIFSFTDYEREFGGLFVSDIFDSTLAYSVNQFFLNGGTNAYVVALKPLYHDSKGNVIGSDQITAPMRTVGSILFTALEPADSNHPMSVLIDNPNDAGDTADFTFTYGTRVETYRKVSINRTNPDQSPNANFIDNRIGTDSKPVSSLVTVKPTGANYTSLRAQPSDLKTPLPFDTHISPSALFATTFSKQDFLNVFQQDSSLDKLPIFNLLVLPGIADIDIWSEALAFCERKLAFLILDPPKQAAADLISAALPGRKQLTLISEAMDTIVPKSTNGAIYFPYLLALNPLTNTTEDFPPSGFVAGIYARTDTKRGVWKAPAGLETTILNTTGVVERGRLTDMRQGTLNLSAVNCLRTFPGTGTVVFGARTLQGATNNTPFQQWRYVPVRRMALFIEQTLYNNLGWVIFEPNDEPLWVAIRTSIENFMLSLFNQGAFQGATPSQAFQVKCDSTTTTQDDINNGIVNIIVAFAPLKPAEFVVIKIAQLAGQTQS